MTIEYLMGRAAMRLQGGLVSGYKLPLNFNLPSHLYLFKKKDPSLAIHTHLMVLYTQNLMLAMPVPLNSRDAFFLDKEVRLPLYPPLFTQFTNLDKFSITRFHGDFSTAQKVTDELDSFSLQMDPTDLTNSSVFDSNTGKFSSAPYNPGTIMKIIIRRGSGGIDPAELHQHISSL